MRLTSHRFYAYEIEIFARHVYCWPEYLLRYFLSQRRDRKFGNCVTLYYGLEVNSHRITGNIRLEASEGRRFKAV